jgi:hypothetical protein
LPCTTALSGTIATRAAIARLVAFIFALFGGAISLTPFAVGPLVSGRADTSWCPGRVLGPQMVRIANAFVTPEGAQ